MLAARTRLLQTRPVSLASSWARSFSLSASLAAPPPVIGSGPAYPRHLLIHANQPATRWPSHLEAVSPLYRQLGKRFAAHPDLAKLGFSFTDAGNWPVEEQWDAARTKFDEPREGGGEERYSATVYPDFLHIPDFSLSSLASFEELYRSLPPPAPASVSSSSTEPSTAPARTHIFVCTHGSRDCRCGDLGEPLYQALLREIRRRKLGGELRDGQDGVRIARVAHIGGHKWAGNALVYKEDGKGCDWYGLLRAEDAPKLLDYATSASSVPWYSRWRGRVNLSPDEVRAEYAARPAAKAEEKSDEPRGELGERVELVFVTHEGEERRVSGYEGESVMCATCHVHVPPITPSPSSSSDLNSSARKPTPVPQLAPLPEMTDEEDEQLEFAIGADDDSRLACQLPVTKELADWVAQGGRIKLPRY
ncbi:hypothetical protein Rhopal_004190-T1 [Rhodotorula paludigena]|uniref:Sucrase/ferredoxin-like-domain-containing protein n=1 Tax=Rhodotorula paludigena TaxID=86838 RepID=A0AAV5GNU6_9BASI|nr:hypothetical protein Rhopal_004190-T1 [Rhodotorula paludigena]